ncbi:MAG: TonB-dependent receptor [Gammaproteobacteria bacterium]|nr:TonB-dependent receptor [Gammaproteobacteria bacterium]MDE0412722.1 TonB-dependent receptor [Gammaproteobacteria bacterium]
MRIRIGMLACAFALVAPPALAQPGAGEIEEVVVTARKQEERIQDVPLTISAFTAAEISERGLSDVMDISQFTPGFSFEKLNRYGVQGGGSRPVIRGQSQILGGANASIFVDGVLYNDSILSFPFDIVERVEVIKGPQAALFGRATFAGAINLITRTGTNEPENRFSLRVAEHEEGEISFLSRGPLAEDTAFYMAHVRYYTYGGFYRNTLDDQLVGDEESINLNLSLELHPSDSFTARFNLGYGSDDDGAAAVTLQDRTYNNCFLEIARQYYCGEVAELDSTEQNLDLFGDDIGLDKTAWRASAQLEWDLGGFTVRSNTGYFSADSTYGYDVDITSNSTALGGTFNRIAVSDRREWSTELLISTDLVSATRLLGGVYLYQSRRDFREDRLNGRTVDQGEARTDNWAVFGSVARDFSDTVTGTLELRYASDKIGNDNPGARATLPLIENTFKTWSPRATLDWKYADGRMIYGTVAVGNKPGFINANPLLDPSLRFAEEEESLNFEVGTKNTLNDGRTTLNVAVYFIDWTKQQLTTTGLLTDGRPVSYVTNAGETEGKGLELEVAHVFNDQFTAGFGYALNDATFTEFDEFSEQARFTGGDPSVAGNQTPNASKHMANAFARYEWPVGANTAYVRADYAYASRKYAQIFNHAHSGDQNLINLKLGLDVGQWQLGLFVRNLTDDRTPSTVIRFVDFKNILPRGDSARTSGFVRAFQYPLADPRQIGLTATYIF